MDKLILFAESLGVNRINFHPIFKMGVPRDTWIDDVNIQPEEWLEVFKEIQKHIDDGRYKIIVRIPQRFITKKEFERVPEYYSYCPVKLGERVLVHPDGIIRICALMIGTPYGVARFYDDKIIWDESNTNETINHELNRMTYCENQRRNFGNYVPLCISFKPKQEEIVWKEKLRWEENFIDFSILSTYLEMKLGLKYIGVEKPAGGLGTPMIVFQTENGTINYVSSQGCPFRCGFCSEVAMYQNKWLYLSPERVVDDIKYLYNEYQINGIKFYDPNFFANKYRVFQFIKLLEKNNIKIKWAASAHPNNLSNINKD